MRKRMQNMVRHNLLAKVISLVVALCLWVIVMDDQNPMVEKEFSVPVVLQNVPTSYRIERGTDTVKAKVRSQRSNFVNVESSDFKAAVDLTGAEEGSYTLPVRLEVPQGFETVEIAPEAVEVSLDPFIEKQFKVDLIVMGSAAPNVTIAGIYPQHQEVMVVGPKSFVMKVSRVIGYVGLAGNTEDFDLQIPLSAINEEGREVPGVRVVPSMTTASIELARGLSKKVVTVKPVLGNDITAGHVVESIKVNPASIEIAGVETTIASIQSVSTEPISLKNKDGTFSATVKLVIPEGITVTNSEVSVNIVIGKAN